MHDRELHLLSDFLLTQSQKVVPDRGQHELQLDIERYHERLRDVEAARILAAFVHHEADHEVAHVTRRRPEIFPREAGGHVRMGMPLKFRAREVDVFARRTREQAMQGSIIGFGMNARHPLLQDESVGDEEVAADFLNRAEPVDLEGAGGDECPDRLERLERDENPRRSGET